MSVQYRVAIGKRDEVVAGPDDATAVFTVPREVVAEPRFDAATEFMRGRLKASGHTGEILDALRDGTATAALIALAG